MIIWLIMTKIIFQMSDLVLPKVTQYESYGASIGVKLVPYVELY